MTTDVPGAGGVRALHILGDSEVVLDNKFQIECSSVASVIPVESKALLLELAGLAAPKELLELSLELKEPSLPLELLELLLPKAVVELAESAHAYHLASDIELQSR